MPFTSHYEHAYSAQHLAVARALYSTLTQQAAGPEQQDVRPEWPSGAQTF